MPLDQAAFLFGVFVAFGCWWSWWFFVGNGVAGSGPAATFFLCFAKEKRQRKATAKPLSLRDSQVRHCLVGAANQLAALKHVCVLYPIRQCLPWQRQSGKGANPRLRHRDWPNQTV